MPRARDYWERVIDPLYTGVLGFRLRRPTYVAQAGIDVRAASRDLKAMVDADLLLTVGETRGRHCIDGPGVRQILEEVRRAEPLADPYPEMRIRLAGLTVQK